MDVRPPHPCGSPQVRSKHLIVRWLQDLLALLLWGGHLQRRTPVTSKQRGLWARPRHVTSRPVLPVESGPMGAPTRAHRPHQGPVSLWAGATTSAWTPGLGSLCSPTPRSHLPGDHPAPKLGSHLTHLEPGVGDVGVLERHQLRTGSPISAVNSFADLPAEQRKVGPLPTYPTQQQSAEGTTPTEKRPGPEMADTFHATRLHAPAMPGDPCGRGHSCWHHPTPRDPFM